MPTEPSSKRAVAFVDGQNLFHSARETFGYTYPNYDVKALAESIARSRDWRMIQTRFYTGIPDIADNARWHRFWTAKLLSMSRSKVYTFSRSLRYRNKTIHLPNGKEQTVLTGEEKGIDVRIALDVIRMAHKNEFDVALIFSQDQDLSEAAEDVRTISQEQKRWIKVASAFPLSPTSRNRRGINKTDWIPIDKKTYDACLDARNYLCA